MKKNDFGKRLKEERTRLGLTQLELAKEIGVTSKTISNYELGKYQTPLYEMLKNGMDVGYLITGIPTNPECLEDMKQAAKYGASPRISKDLIISIIKQYLEYLR